ncbi:4256_t:CDS:2, partial [Racocetra persica]
PDATLKRISVSFSHIVTQKIVVWNFEKEQSSLTDQIQAQYDIVSLPLFDLDTYGKERALCSYRKPFIQI